jgi:hypothetical protein
MRAMRLDHVSYAAGPEGLASTVQRLGSDLGAGFTDGGIHPRFGTRNFVLPLAGGTYLEAVGVLDHPAADRAPFGQAVKARAQEGGGWFGWVVAVDDLAPVVERIGRQPVEGHRRLPDGTELRWHQLGVLDIIDDPQLPFFVCWDLDSASHPSAGARTDLRIERIEIAGDRRRLDRWLGEPEGNPADEADVSVEWVDGDRPGIVAVHVATPRGTVRLD